MKKKKKKKWKEKRRRRREIHGLWWYTNCFSPTYVKQTTEYVHSFFSNRIRLYLFDLYAPVSSEYHFPLQGRRSLLFFSRYIKHFRRQHAID